MFSRPSFGRVVLADFFVITKYILVVGQESYSYHLLDIY